MGDHRLDQLTGHPREGEEVLHAATDQRPDNVMHVAARAEVAAGTGHHHRLHLDEIDVLIESDRAPVDLADPIATDVDLAIDKGSRVVVLGLNGAGKTTSIAKLAWILKNQMNTKYS